MISADSRYQDSVKAFSTAHIYDQYGRILFNADDGTPQVRTSTRETIYRLSIPNADPPPPLEYHVKEGETMQFLAWKTMRRHSSWWQLAEANPHIWYPLDMPIGTVVRVPV
jgi:LysM domain